MDPDELEARCKSEPRSLEAMGGEELEACIRELEAEIARARAEIARKRALKGSAERLFKG